MGKLLAQTVPLALGAAISPVLFLLQLTTLTGPRPIGRGLALAAGAAVPLAIAGAVAVIVGNSTSFSESSTLKAALDMIFGAVLLGLGAWAALQPPKPRASKHAERAHGPARSFALGAAGMATNVTTFALYVPAMKLIAAAEVDDATRGFVTLIVFVITLATVLVPLALTVVAPSTSGRVLAAVGDWMRTHQRATTVVLGFGFGAWLLIRGVAAL
jgi:hypothetical protein